MNFVSMGSIVLVGSIGGGVRGCLLGDGERGFWAATSFCGTSIGGGVRGRLRGDGERGF